MSSGGSFEAFCGVLRRVGQMFGGAQSPFLVENMSKWGGSGPLSAMKTFFLVSSSQPTRSEFSTLGEQGVDRYLELVHSRDRRLGQQARKF